MRDHRRIPASRVSPPLPNSSVREPVHTSREPSKPRWDLDTTWGGCGGPGPAQSGKSREERDGGGAEFQSPRNLVPRNLESEQETGSHRASLSLRHKSKKEGVGHTARTHTPAPVSLRTTLEESGRMGEKNTHMPLFI